MRVTDNEYADPALPKVVDAPDEIWLVYGELEHDDTHLNCCASGEVFWCEDSQFPADVRYLRADVSDARILGLEDLLREALETLTGPQAINCIGMGWYQKTVQVLGPPPNGRMALGPNP